MEEKTYKTSDAARRSAKKYREKKQGKRNIKFKF